MCVKFSTDLEVCDKPAKFIKEELGRALNKLAGDKKKVVLVYFMGYTKTVSLFFIIIIWAVTQRASPF